MIRENEVFKIGQLHKTHGVKGEIAFKFENDAFDRVDCPYLILKMDGIFVPFFLDEYCFKNNETALISFVDIDSEEKASRLQGVEVYFPREYYEEVLDDEDADFSWNYFIGFIVCDEKKGVLGKITSVDTQTINTLFLIEGSEDQEFIIPASEDFIINIDTETHQLNLRLPEGLIQ